MKYKVGDTTINKKTGEKCTVISLQWGKVTVQYEDEFNCIQILESEQLEIYEQRK